jgi:hypothetical protein
MNFTSCKIIEYVLQCTVHIGRSCRPWSTRCWSNERGKCSLEIIWKGRRSWSYGPIYLRNKNDGLSTEICIGNITAWFLPDGSESPILPGCWERDRGRKQTCSFVDIWAILCKQSVIACEDDILPSSLYSFILFTIYVYWVVSPLGSCRSLITIGGHWHRP